MTGCVDLHKWSQWLGVRALFFPHDFKISFDDQHDRSCPIELRPFEIETMMWHCAIGSIMTMLSKNICRC